jgi:hypothetical protein
MAVVVDTGRKARTDELAQALDAFLAGQVPDLRRIDRLILTHEDDDHCGGASQFIGRWVSAGREIGQVWLPSMWAPAGAAPSARSWVRSRIVKGALEAAPQIAEAARKLAAEYQDPLSSGEQATHDPYSDEVLMKAVRQAAVETGVLAEFFGPVGRDGGASRLEQVPEVHDAERPFRWRERYFPGLRVAAADGRGVAAELALMLQEEGELPPAGEHSTLGLQLADGALDTHPRVAKAVAACVAFGLPVRWFDFGQFESSRTASGGDAGFLTPVNAVEVVARLRSVSPKALFYALALSRANRECLAFLRHEEGTEPAVLFTGDSRLSTWGKGFPPPAAGLPVRRNILVTAMHHASSHNQQGYGVLRTWLGKKPSPLFVRNGGQGVTSAAKGFLRASERLCVRCIGSKLPAVPVRVEVYGSRWRMPNHPRPCTCKPAVAAVVASPGA